LLIIFVVGIIKAEEGQIIQAKLFILDGDYEEALSILTEEEKSAEVLYLMGEIYLKKGDTEQAKRMYEKALVEDESLNKARVKIIKLYSDKQKTDIAKQHLEILSGYLSNEEIIKDLQNYIDKNTIKKEKKLDVYTGAYYIYNDNVSLGIDKDEISGVEIHDDYKKKSDTGIKVFANIMYNKKLKSSLFLRPTIALESENYFKYSEESFQKINFYFNILKVKTRSYYSIPFIVSGTLKDSELENSYYGFMAKYGYMYNDLTTLNTNFEFYRKRNHIGEYNGNISSLNVYVDMFKKGKNYLRPALKYIYEDYEINYYGYSSLTAKLEYSREFNGNIVGKIGVESDLLKNYKAKEPGMDSERDDSQLDLNLDISKHYKTTSINFKLDYLINDSNYELYEYENLKLSFGIIRAF